MTSSMRRFSAFAISIAAAATVGILSLVLVAPRAPAATCPGKPLTGVQRPNQLTVLDPGSPCRTGVGVVRADHREHDGDCHVNIKLDAAYTKLLNSTNTSKAGGLLITEVIPGHTLPIPKIGSRVRIVGTWVFDKATGWRELHPVWTITVLSVGNGTTGSC